MIRPWAAAQRTLGDFAHLTVEVFTGDRRHGAGPTAVLLLACSLFSLLLSALLLLYLLFTLGYDSAVAGGVAGCFGTLLIVALFLSKRVRCLGTLFVISVFIKKSRSLLLAAGTSLVILKNIRNALENLAALAGSMVCNLKAKKASIAAPFRNYVEMLRWIGDMLKTDLVLGKLDSRLRVSPRLESERFREKLAEAEQKLNDTVKYVQSLTATVSSVTSRLFPAVSLLVLLVLIVLHMKRYRNDVKYKNRCVTTRLLRLDERQRVEGRPSVFPLTAEEERLYSARATATDARAVLRFMRPVASYLVHWAVIIMVDALMYYFVNVVTVKLSELEPFHVPLLTGITEIFTLAGVPLAGERREKDFSYSVTLFEKQCLPEAKLLLHSSICPLAAILLALLLMAVAAGRMSQLRLRVCERFFPGAAEKRAEHLHEEILQRRSDRRRQRRPCSVKALLRKPEFWCPLLFQPKESPVSNISCTV
ncbi:dendritic cell-specific transmembrane protein [Betta splendens]|uniref:Dendritic cell-specific transmembrane protein n=1 Tax=Betta splendens TaxID=158456 RepID=A0A6P7KRR8_BETSP|nr:dendritic cell-specific transmembrane protein [Betta splendens]